MPQLEAQDASGSTMTLKVTTRLVVLDVRVVDSKGNFVPGLDASQFNVYEGKELQRVRNFEGPAAHQIAANTPAVRSTADLIHMPNAPVNVLVIDELNTAFGDTARAQQALRHFLEQQPEKLPVPTLFLGAGASRVAVLHDFTQSRDELLASLKIHVTDVDFRALTNQMAGGSMSAPEGFAKTLGALSQVASSLRGIRGHKNVIWVGSGFDNAYDLTSAGDSDAQMIADALKLVTVRLLDARISLSTLDPAGMDADQPVESLDAEAQVNAGSTVSTVAQDVSFDSLAESTGGTVVHGRNDLKNLITRDASESADYYTLTYSPTSPSNDPQEFRQIRVVMKNPNLRAITRTGYFPAGVEEAPVTPEQPKTQSREFKFDLTSAANSRLIYTGLRVGARPIPGGYNVQVEAADLQWQPGDEGKRRAEVSILAVAFNSKDRAVVQDAQEFKEQILDTQDVKGSLVGFKVPLDVSGGVTRLRFVVRDAATGNMGSFDMPLQH